MTGLHAPDTTQPTEGLPAQRDPGPSRAGSVRPQLGAGGWLRWGWRQLTSMRTALILLFLLALGSVTSVRYQGDQVTGVSYAEPAGSSGHQAAGA